jgi:hypothetical protein
MPTPIIPRASATATAALDLLTHGLENAAPYPASNWTDEMREARESYFNALCAAQFELHRLLAGAWSRHHARVFHSPTGGAPETPLMWQGHKLQTELDAAVFQALTNTKEARDDFNAVMYRHARGDLTLKPVAFKFAVI